jgi:hypothetical protein
MPCVGSEPMIPVSERAKTVHALERSATVTGPYNFLLLTTDILQSHQTLHDLTQLNEISSDKSGTNSSPYHLTFRCDALPCPR